MEGRDRQQLNIVIVGHVDHGKSTVIGRLLADTGSLPEGKLEDVKSLCARTAKPFEYAFLLDALKDERAQGITIDSARCFFKTKKRDYIVIDAPGHIEFLKNMVTGAARAEAALLVIAADEGIRENSKRHGYLVSMLGIRQVVVLINKMDLVGYDAEAYRNLCREFIAFLSELKVLPLSFIPVSARDGENIASRSEAMPWYDGPTVLEQLDGFEQRTGKADLPLRFPVQDIYKFTEEGDDRRIIAGTIETGSMRVGDEIVFLPSGKRTRLRSIEAFNTPRKDEARAEEAIGITLETQLYVRPGEIIGRVGDTAPKVGSRFRAHLFWMGRSPLVKGRTYKLKLAACRASVTIAEVVQVLDAADLHVTRQKQQLDRHDVGEVALETTKPIAFAPIASIEGTGRFVIVDNYEIAGGGIVLDEANTGASLMKNHVREREVAWDKGFVTPSERSRRNGHKSKFVVFAGDDQEHVRALAKGLEKSLFFENRNAYYLGLDNMLSGLGSDTGEMGTEAGYPIRLLGELARILTDSGQIFIAALSGIDDYDLETLKTLNAPSEILVISVGDNLFSRYQVDLVVSRDTETGDALPQISRLLREQEIIPEYFI